MRQHRWRVMWVAALAALSVTVAAQQQEDPVAEYRELFGEDNPAELWEARGAGFWSEPRGPKNVALSSCDFGLGAGVIEGAYARLPRYFADTGRVEDLESRLVTCMTTIQGFDRDTLLRSRFGDGDKKSDLEALTAYIVGQSRGHIVDVKTQHPAEKAAYDTGKALFFYRAGPHDFSCASCHGEPGSGFDCNPCRVYSRKKTPNLPLQLGLATASRKGSCERWSGDWPIVFDNSDSRSSVTVRRLQWPWSCSWPSMPTAARWTRRISSAR